MRATTPCLATVLSTHYEVLKLPRSASASEIKKQFYILSKELHPDRTLHHTASERARARERFDAVSEAYSVLGHADRRREYDSKIRAEYASAATGNGNGINPFYRTPGEQRSPHFSGLNRTRTRAQGATTSRPAGSGEYYDMVGGQKVPKGSHAFSPTNTGLGGGYATGLNDDVPHFVRV